MGIPKRFKGASFYGERAGELQVAGLDTLLLCSVGQQAWLCPELVLKLFAKIKAFVLIKLFLYIKRMYTVFQFTQITITQILIQE